MFEQPQDLYNEQEAIKAFLRVFNCEARKMGEAAFCDYQLISKDKLVGYVEIKTRNYTMPQIIKMGGYKLALQKWDTARRICGVHRVDFILLLKLLDGYYYHITRDFHIDDCVHEWGRKDRNHVSAIEPAIVLYSNRFKKL
jgi:hypothetical protein